MEQTKDNYCHTCENLGYIGKKMRPCPDCDRFQDIPDAERLQVIAEVFVGFMELVEKGGTFRKFIYDYIGCPREHSLGVLNHAGGLEVQRAAYLLKESYENENR